MRGALAGIMRVAGTVPAKRSPPARGGLRTQALRFRGLMEAAALDPWSPGRGDRGQGCTSRACGSSRGGRKTCVLSTS